MSPIPERRPLREGFLTLVPDAAKCSLKYHITEIERLASEARSSSEQSRHLALDAVWEDEQGFTDRAKRDRDGAAVDHRRAADHLFRLARACRALLAFAALDWRPGPEVVGHGLTHPELSLLCAVMGRSTEEVTAE